MRLSSPVPKKRARIEIIPLIDIMFFLLASFMMVSLSQTHMKGIRVNLPAAVGPPPSGVKDFVSVKVLEGNAVFFDNQYVPDDQVLPRLFGLHRGNQDIKISISATPMAIYGDVIGVLERFDQSESQRSAIRLEQLPPLRLAVLRRRPEVRLQESLLSYEGHRDTFTDRNAVL